MFLPVSVNAFRRGIVTRGMTSCGKLRFSDSSSSWWDERSSSESSEMALEERLCRGDDGVETVGETFDPSEAVWECEGSRGGAAGILLALSVTFECESASSLRGRLGSLDADADPWTLGLSITSASVLAVVVDEDAVG
jgi:hypothetical protein